MQEGPPRKKISLDESWEAFLLKQGNAFLDYMLESNDEEKHFAMCAFRLGDRPSCKWVFSGKDCVQIVNGLNSILFQVKRDELPDPCSPVDPFPLLRFPWSRDDSIKLLPREVLSVIYTFLRNPTDMWSFMRVSKTFYKAGEIYPHYKAHIEKLLPSFAYPVWDETFGVRQFFFAFCFISCKTDSQLSDKWMQYIRTDGQGKDTDMQHGDEALFYILHLLGYSGAGGFVRRKEDWTKVYQHQPGIMGLDITYFAPIVDSEGLKTESGRFKKIPFEILREIIVKILF